MNNVIFLLRMVVDLQVWSSFILNKGLNVKYWWSEGKNAPSSVLKKTLSNCICATAQVPRSLLLRYIGILLRGKNQSKSFIFCKISSQFLQYKSWWLILTNWHHCIAHLLFLNQQQWNWFASSNIQIWTHICSEHKATDM